MVACLTTGDFSQDAGWGGVGRALVLWVEEAPEDFVWGGGFPDCPRGCASRGEHGVCPCEDRWAIGLWAGGCRGLHYIIVPALLDCTPELWQRLLAVCA